MALAKAVRHGLGESGQARLGAPLKLRHYVLGSAA
jgi:hypothetical protein